MYGVQADNAPVLSTPKIERIRRVTNRRRLSCARSHIDPATSETRWHIAERSRVGDGWRLMWPIIHVVGDVACSCVSTTSVAVETWHSSTCAFFVVARTHADPKTYSFWLRFYIWRNLFPNSYFIFKFLYIFPFSNILFSSAVSLMYFLFIWTAVLFALVKRNAAICVNTSRA